MTDPPSQRDHWLMPLATGFGLGHAPFAPGTFGSLWGPLLVWGLQWPTAGPGWLQWSAIPVFLLLGIPVCAAGSRVLGRVDPGVVVFDEIAAFPIVFVTVELNAFTAVVGFLAFRVFDIAKPWPVRMVERLPGGLGIMADDTVAGLQAAVVLQLAVWLV